MNFDGQIKAFNYKKFKDSSLAFTLIFVLAFCSIVYELTLCQMLAAINGNTISQYSMVIGIYIASLGFGSLLVGFFEPKNTSKLFIQIEFFLALLGGLSPLVLLFYKALGLYSSFSVHLLVILIGLLSGMEIPLASQYLKNRSNNCNYSFILGADYFGSVVGCVVFPLLLYPSLGVFYTAVSIGALNLVMAILIGVAKSNVKKSFYLLCVSAFLLYLVLALKLNSLSELVIGRVYG